MPKSLHKDIVIFFSLILLLLIMSVIFVYSSSSVFALERYGNPHYYLYRHIIGLLIGTIALIGMRYIPLGYVKKGAPFLFIGSLIMSGMTVYSSFGSSIHGSHRWLRFYHMSFQPSELLKLSFLLYLAYFFAKKSHLPFSFWHTFFPFLMTIGLVSFVLLQQPDFGLTITLITVALLLFFVTQQRIWYGIITLLATFLAGIILIIIRPYRLQRILVFLDPWKDPQGSGFQIIQSLIAIGAGNWFGLGISHSKQKFFYLPMQHTDFIFSIIAEELGFFGSCLIISLFLGILYIGIKISLQLRDLFCQLTMLGFVLLICLQALINIAMATGLLPTKGLGLPFISYGNTALTCNIAMLGLISNMIHNQPDY